MKQSLIPEQLGRRHTASHLFQLDLEPVWAVGQRRRHQLRHHRVRSCRRNHLYISDGQNLATSHGGLRRNGIHPA